MKIFYSMKERKKQMKFYKVMSTIIAVLAIGILGGCAEQDPGTPPEVLIDGVSVVVGQTTPKELEEQGFETNAKELLLLKMPDNSWTSSIYLRKDRTSYASLTLVNDSKEEKLVNQCVIEELGFYALDDTNKDLNISINGINPIGMTQDALKEAYPDLELDDGSSDYLFHYLRDGEYTICFEYSHGILTDIDVKHKFDKSYQSK